MSATATAKGRNRTSAIVTARQLLAEALAIGESDLPLNPRIGMIELWDSLAHARILIGIEEHIGKQLDGEEAVAIESLEDIAAVIERHS
jgi:acyl carrier protein